MPFGIVATKAEHTRAAVARCADVFADAAVASVQNGLGNEEVLAELVPRVIRGTIVTAGAVTAPGRGALRRAGGHLARAVRAQARGGRRDRALPSC